jgi:hypothetical protein
MTETQTCPHCGDTGYMPPFMDPCACGARILATLPPVGPIVSKPAAATSIWGTGSEVAAAEAHIGDLTVTLDGGTAVWTGTEWATVPTETLSAAEYADKYGTPAGLSPLTSVPFLRPPVDADVEVALDAVADPELDVMLAEEQEIADRVVPKTAKETFAALEAACDTIGMTHAEVMELVGYGPLVDDIEMAADEVLVHLETDEKIDTIRPVFGGAAIAAYPSATVVRGVTKPMSEKQETLLRRLVAERDPANPYVAGALDKLAETPVLISAKTASKMIDTLVAIKADPAKKPARRNSYDGICIECGGEVPAGTGHIVQIDGRWKTVHSTSAHCLTDAAKAAMEADRVDEPGLYKHEVDGIPIVYRVRTARTTKRLYGELVVPPATADDKVEFLYNGKAMAFLRKSNRLTWQEARDFGAAYGACIACGRTLEDPRSLVQQYGATCAGHHGWPTVTKTQAEAIIAGVLTWEDVTGLPG